LGKPEDVSPGFGFAALRIVVAVGNDKRYENAYSVIE